MELVSLRVTVLSMPLLRFSESAVKNENQRPAREGEMNVHRLPSRGRKFPKNILFIWEVQHLREA